MPTVNGQYYLADFVTELQAKGFDGFSVADLQTYVNRGYMHVARKSRWYWEETSDAFHLDPGQFSVPLWPQASGELPNFKSMDNVYITNPAGFRSKLDPVSRDDFFQQWFPLDLTSGSNRGTPDGYAVWQQNLYILRPPQVAMDFLANYHRRVVPLSTLTPGVTDLPITPPHLDEAIMIAAEIRCHERAKELSFATQKRVDLEEFFDDMRDDESELVDELPDRVSPDDTWD